MNSIRLVSFLLSVVFADACTKEEYAENFGALPTYELHAMEPHTPPHTHKGSIIAEVSYSSPCPNGGSSFAANVVDKHGMQVVMLFRHEPVCDNPMFQAMTWTGQVTAEIVSNGSFELGPKYIAFPPDADYELWTLSEKDAPEEAVQVDADSVAEPLTQDLSQETGNATEKEDIVVQGKVSFLTSLYTSLMSFLQ